MIGDLACVKILKTGPGTSIRDTGRKGYARYGVPVSGPADRLAFDWVNHLLKNDPNAAVLEISQPGLLLLFDSPAAICLAGATAKIEVNGKSSVSSGILMIREYDLLEVGAFSTGSILYLGISGGFQSEKVLNSRSFYSGITPLSYYKKGDLAPFNPPYSEIQKPTYAVVKWNVSRYNSEIIPAFPGPEWSLLSQTQKNQLTGKPMTISVMKNAMAIQLEELLTNSLPEISTAPVFPGTVQLTPGGKLICLMQDAQVTGGYPRVLQLSDEAIGLIAQKKPGSKVKFNLLQ